MTASFHGHTDVVKVLLENNAQVNLQEKNGWSSLMIACQLSVNNAQSDSSLIIASSIMGNVDIVKVLLENNALQNDR